MTHLPRMSLHVGDYLKNTMHLSAEMHGAYLMLILHYWECRRLPDDDPALARIARVSGRRWKKIKPIIQAFFHDGWKHARVDDEYETQKLLSQIRSAAGQEGAKVKKKQRDAQANASAELKQNASSPSPSPSPVTIEEEAKASSPIVKLAAKRGSHLPKDWYPNEADLKFATDLGFRLYEIDNIANQFIDYWHARAGAGSVKRDWSATWRNRCRQLKETSHGGGNGRQLQDDRLSVSKAADRLLAQPELGVPPRPSLVRATGETDRRLLPKG